MGYIEAKHAYAALGVDTEQAMETIGRVPLSLHCWQGDDVTGFDRHGALSGGIQATGNYPGKATTPQQLMDDLDMAFRLIPGKHKLNLHASYAIFAPGSTADRNALLPEHFAKWVDFARARGMGIDFNPTFFGHPLAASGLTLSSPDESIRQFWVEHGKCCLKIAEYFADELSIPCVLNIWIPDGYKDIPADRFAPRERFRKSLDEILSIPYDRSKVHVCLESKVFGIGVESYTVGSAEFCLNYAAIHGILPLMDNGHYHPTEMVSDKISAMLLFHEKIALHITRAVRWDSDHVVLFDEETREIANEIVRCNALERVFLATDFFDASINRISAWVTGARSVQKALLCAALQPHKTMQALQDAGNMTELMVLQEELKLLPFGAVWAEYLQRQGVPREYLPLVRAYEKEELETRV